ncbi:RNA-binding S4 domain-containing protein [Selenomonas ruminantium]|jgi:ribosome-associated protein|uniref:Ribosome-associated protein n=1 Tax=Selenomonas ruminantium TaxID=971 RepID=A0A1K1NHT3_SELRU|nr:RNA-binding S4 domain-containing protein [Selenomonas ruminantium]SDZ90958.1 ribosome-associated protein [Selenomonas ruminantium]SFB01954.1 ribosome-associated protein [Selenomonas ruminantium]SFW34899.1 ribosome-associated protein [Selenomonas ruminantium]
MQIEDIEIETEEIQLDQFLKWAGVLPSGGEVKALLAEGLIFRNGEKESARRRKLHDGDVIEITDMGAWRVKVNK